MNTVCVSALLVVALASSCGDVTAAMENDASAGAGGTAAGGTMGSAGAPGGSSGGASTGGTTGAGGAAGGSGGAQPEICPAPGCAPGQTCMNGYCYGYGICAGRDDVRCVVSQSGGGVIGCDGASACTIQIDGKGKYQDGRECQCGFNHSGLVVDCAPGFVCH